MLKTLSIFWIVKQSITKFFCFQNYPICRFGLKRTRKKWRNILWAKKFGAKKLKKILQYYQWRQINLLGLCTWYFVEFRALVTIFCRRYLGNYCQELKLFTSLYFGEGMIWWYYMKYTWIFSSVHFKRPFIVNWNAHCTNIEYGTRLICINNAFNNLRRQTFLDK